MEAIRVRFAPAIEWLCAAAILAGLLAAERAFVQDGVDGVGHVRAAAAPVVAHEAPALEAPPAIGSGAVSLPLILLSDGKEIHLGDIASRIVERLGPSAQVGADAIERDGARERITRIYNYVGTRFALVFEAARQDAEPRVVAIYRQ
jgi:hypothetical protein